MKGIILNKETEKQLQELLEHPAHGIMLCGPSGSGKLFTAKHLASELLMTEINKLEEYPYFLHINPIKNSIGIEQIRELNKFTQLKTYGKNDIRRVSIISDAHLMTVEAQNALLKMLEEPPEDTAIILTVVGDRSLRPTVYSRVMKVNIKNPDMMSLAKYFSKFNYSSEEVSKAYALSAGCIGLMQALLGGFQEHPLAESILNAKQLITSSLYDRLKKVDEYSKDKSKLPDLFFAFKRIAQVGITQSADRNDIKSLNRWTNMMQEVYYAEDRSKHNPNQKLLLTDLFLNI